MTTDTTITPCPPQCTPWGPAQTVKDLGDGVYAISTVSHGGYWLSPKAMAKVRKLFPTAMLFAGDPWFEEDCDWCFVAITFWKKFPIKASENAQVTLRNSHPECYERLHGVTLQPGESREKDDQAFYENNKNNWVTVSAVGSWHEQCPEGYVLVSACIGGRKEHRFLRPTVDFLVPQEEYDARTGPFVIDTSRHSRLDHFAAKAQS
ncbi:MAG: DUF7007 domain-containing protein [Betaproteobacteria bacterium]